MSPQDVWKVCSACRTPIHFGQTYSACSVSTCAKGRNALFFCSVGCWDSHLSSVRHRESWAIEVVAPSREEAARLEREERAAPAPTRTVVAPGGVTTRPAAPGAPRADAPSVSSASSSSPSSPSSSSGATGTPLSKADESEVLIVVSKLKKYIRERSGMNTSDAVAEMLSHHVRAICDDAIRTAGADGRRTVLDRDVPRPRRS